VNVREIYSRVSPHFSELYLEIENRMEECSIHWWVINNGDKNPSCDREVLLTDTLKDLKLGLELSEPSYPADGKRRRRKAVA